MKKIQLFYQNHGLSPFQKCQFWPLFYPCLYCLERLVFKRGRHQILFLGVFCIKRNVNKNSTFDQNHGLTPLEKSQFCGFLKRCCRYSQSLLCYIKRQKSFFYDLFSPSMKWEYRGLHGVREGYKGLKGVSGGYKGWQGITRGYSRLKGVKGG